MKILQINKLYYPVIGGIENIVKNIAEGLNNWDGNTTEVLACQEKSTSIEKVVNGVKIYKSKSFGKVLGMPISIDFFKLFFKIKNNYDIFILHYPFPLASLISPFIPKEKLVIYYHSDIVRQKFFRIPFLPFINSSLNRAKKIIVSGNNIINSSPSLKKYKEKCEVIPFGINYDFKDEDIVESEKIKEKYKKDKLILGIGRLVYYKGFKYAIKSMTDVNANLLIIGTGQEENKLKKLISELGLEDKVFIIPQQERLAPFFLASDLFVFPSTERSEAFGLVQLEAMARGLPIVNTYLKTAVEEVSLDGISGLTVEAKNSKSLSEAINKILNNKKLRLEYSKNATKRYQELFTQEKFLEKIKINLFL